ncbi:MAG: GGDEF domain-containing protein [Mycobacteriales bacterium]
MSLVPPGGAIHSIGTLFDKGGMGHADRGRPAARQAAYLFAGSGLLALAALALPVRGPRVDLAWVGLADLAVAGLAFLLPWRRWPPVAPLVLGVPALAVISASQALGLIPASAFGVFFVVAFAWVGAHFPRGASFALAPFAAAAYLAASLAAGGHADPPWRALVVALGACLLVGETIAAATTSLARARRRAERASESFRVVSRASAGLRTLDPEEVLAAVTDAVMALGYDSANLAFIDPVTDRFTASHPRGLATRYVGGSFSTSDGITGEVRDSGEPVLVRDYQVGTRRIEAIRASGLRSVVAVPVSCAGELTAVLHAGSRQILEVHAEDVEALRLLAETAGAALENARLFSDARESARNHARASVTDALTGLGNRRYAQRLLHRLRPGDTVAMIDLDHFKVVNDEFGHAFGDQALVALAGHLMTQLRDVDDVARYGGEEFFVVLPQTELEHAGRIIDRLLATWRETSPPATFSAGLAAHEAQTPGEETLARADRALYLAKAGGRDRACADAGPAVAVTLPAPRGALTPTRSSQVAYSSRQARLG